MDEKSMKQVAPWPEVLDELVSSVRYKKHWTFSLEEQDRGQGSEGLTLVIVITTPDSYHPEKMRSVAHYFIVPAAAYDMRSWRRWLFDQILLVERHEAMEFFQIITQDDLTGEAVNWPRPYAPSHGFGQDPYMIREIGTEQDVKTSFRNEVRV